MHQSVRILGGYQSDFACNLMKEAALDVGGNTNATMSLVGTAQS